MGEYLANIHGYRTGAEGDQRTVPAAVVKFAKAGAGEADHENQQPARIAQRLDLRESLFDILIIQQLMLCHNHNMLNLRDDVHVDAAIGVFSR